MDDALWQWFLATVSSSSEEAFPIFCAWCWAEAHPSDPFPAHWSSRLCPDHDAQIRQHAAMPRKRARPF